ncbi:hypothetical protein EVAR_68540_1 [Eumeta japonica]|uniref:Uncharacterized protein n=1 Tax=Eumeta variegata TaxID=151549 RepID=A0A4C1ZWM5_EUMVA|nr:hypothetical protein EVAR_68540_1 [Eumeta japonica]
MGPVPAARAEVRFYDLMSSSKFAIICPQTMSGIGSSVVGAKSYLIAPCIGKREGKKEKERMEKKEDNEKESRREIEAKERK